MIRVLSMALVHPPQPEKWQHVLEMRRIGYTIAQIAGICGISKHTIEERINLGGQMRKKDLDTIEAHFRAEWDECRPSLVAAAARCMAEAGQSDPVQARHILNWAASGIGIEKHVHSGPDDGPVPLMNMDLDLGMLDLEEQLRLREMAKKMIGISSERAELEDEDDVERG